MLNKEWVSHVMLFLSSLIYAANFTIAKEVMPAWIAPFGLIVLRVAAAFVLFWLTQALFIRERIQRKDLFLLIVCAVFGVVTNQLLFFKGLSLTTPIQGALIMLTTPIMVLLISLFVLKERITLFRLVGISFGLAGAIWLVLSGNAAATAAAPNPGLGNLFIGINALSYGFYLVLAKPISERYHPITVTTWVFTFGLPLTLPFGVPELQGVNWSEMPPAIWWSIAFILVGVTYLTYLFNALALRRLSPSVVSGYIYLQPVLTTLIAVVSGKDQLHLNALLAAMLILIGVGLISYKPRPIEQKI